MILVDNKNKVELTAISLVFLDLIYFIFIIFNTKISVNLAFKLYGIIIDSVETPLFQQFPAEGKIAIIESLLYNTQ